MNWKKLFFSFEGRINRAKFWLLTLVALIALAPLGLAFLHPSEWLYLLAFLGGLAAVYLGLVAAIKRLHDRGKSGEWVIVFYVVPALLDRIAGALPDRMPYLVAALLVYVCSLAVSIWAIAEFGCRRGTAGPNDYGPDPLVERT